MISSIRVKNPKIHRNVTTNSKILKECKLWPVIVEGALVIVEGAL